MFGCHCQTLSLPGGEAGLAVDGDPESCSRTPRTTGPRWWQVELAAPALVTRISLTLPRASHQHLTVFVIELLAGPEDRALYKEACSNIGRQGKLLNYKLLRKTFSS